MALTGCSDRTTAADDTPTGTVSSAATETPTAPTDSTPSASVPPSSPASSASIQATETPTSSAPEPAATSTAPAGPAKAGLRSRLLPAGDVPGFNEEFRWAEAATATREPRTPFGTCQRFDLSAIGAVDVAVRTYRATPASPTDTAGELVAEFPDATTARRAYAVLTSWRAKCADRIDRYRRSDVGALEDVRVPGGTGGWYLLTYGPLRGDRDSQYFDAQGMTMVGSRIAMVELVLAGQDYNYEPGREPMVTAVQRAAARLS
jgi:hypothetical protein